MGIGGGGGFRPGDEGHGGDSRAGAAGSGGMEGIAGDGMDQASAALGLGGGGGWTQREDLTLGALGLGAGGEENWITRAPENRVGQTPGALRTEGTVAQGLGWVGKESKSLVE